MAGVKEWDAIQNVRDKREEQEAVAAVFAAEAMALTVPELDTAAAMQILRPPVFAPSAPFAPSVPSDPPAAREPTAVSAPPQPQKMGDEKEQPKQQTINQPEAAQPLQIKVVQPQPQQSSPLQFKTSAPTPNTAGSGGSAVVGSKQSGTKLQSLPPLPKLSVGGVCDYLRSIGKPFEPYVSSFAANYINGAALCEATDADLIELGVTNRFHRLRILGDIKQAQALTETE